MNTIFGLCKRLKTALLSTSLICVLLRCASINHSIKATDHLIDQKAFAVPASSFSRSLLSKDLGQLLYFFRNGYAGYNYIDNNIIKHAEKSLIELDQRQLHSWVEFCDAIGEIFIKLPDGHLNAAFNRRKCGATNSTQNKQFIGENVAGYDQSKPFILKLLQHQGKKVAVLGISHFPPFADKRWVRFEQAIKRLKNFDIIIIDLRGNTGGDDTRGMQLASELSGRNLSKSEYAQDFEINHPAAFTLLLNKITLKEQKSSKGALKKFRQIYEVKLNQPTTSKTNSYFNQNFNFFSVNGEKYLKPIYVLADGECGSAGESTLHALKQSANTKFVGQRTAGVTHFGNQGLLILGNSRIRVSMSTKFIHFLDGSFVEKKGHKPDIFVPNGEDALEFTLNKLVSNPKDSP